MGVVEAFDTLGLEEPDELSAEQLKRSYLRILRTRLAELERASEPNSCRCTRAQS